ncbi:MAG: O-antigen ligase family protein [Armatimonadota bacterium]
MVSSVLLLLAIVLAPIIGGKLSTLTNGFLYLIILGGVCCRLFLAKDKSGAWLRVPGLWFAAAFLLAYIISTCFSRSVYFSLSQMVFFAACFGAYLLTSSLSDDRRMATATVWVLLLSALIISAMGVRDYALDTGGGIHFWRSLMGGGEHGRLFGPFLNPSFFAGYLVITLPVTLGIFLVTRRGLFVVLAGFAFVVQTLALMLTGAKFGIIAAVLSLGLFFLLAIVTKALRRSRFLRLLVLCAVLTPLLVLFSAPVKSRIQAAESGGSQVHSTVFRAYTWQATLDMIYAQPWLGTGPGTYPITYQEYTIAGPTRMAHNSYLQLAAESGVPAAGAFLLMLLALAVSALTGTIYGSSRRSDIPTETADEPAFGSVTWTDILPFSGWRLLNCALFAALFGSAVRSLVDSDWYISGIAIPFWVVAGVLVSRSGAADKKVNLAPVARTAAGVGCVVLMVMMVSFSLGDLYANRAEAVYARNPNDAIQIIELYKKAVAASPLMPTYRRQLATWLSTQSAFDEEAYKQVDIAIKLARRTSEGGWFAKGVIAQNNHDLPLAISSFRKALVYHPNSTRTLYKLALIYRETDDMENFEAVLRRLMAIESSDYENIKGTPEIIDGTYAFAHAYFAEKYLARHYYSASIREYRAAINRLERWRASGDMREVQRRMGLVTKSDAEEMLQLLKDCYTGLSVAYSAIGNKAQAVKATAQASKVR